MQASWLNNWRFWKDTGMSSFEDFNTSFFYIWFPISYSSRIHMEQLGVGSARGPYAGRFSIEPGGRGSVAPSSSPKPPQTGDTSRASVSFAATEETHSRSA